MLVFEYFSEASVLVIALCWLAPRCVRAPPVLPRGVCPCTAHANKIAFLPRCHQKFMNACCQIWSLSRCPAVGRSASGASQWSLHASPRQALCPYSASWKMGLHRGGHDRQRWCRRHCPDVGKFGERHQSRCGAKRRAGLPHTRRRPARVCRSIAKNLPLSPCYK